MRNFSVKELADLAGVTVRTLHIYDKMGLLKPSVRTDARYRFYGEEELLRLQQILFYRELGLPLKEIADILDDPDFNLIAALETHKSSLRSKQNRISEMLETIDNTILKLKGERVMTNYKELYKGFSAEQAEELREGAIKAYGKKAIEKSENYLGQLSKQEINKLQEEQMDTIKSLISLMSEKPDSARVQKQIARHYQLIRQFWGTVNNPDPQLEAYKGLGELYISDDRFTASMTGAPNPEFAIFMRDAMAYFAEANK